jgi:hypothetical protein
MRRPADAILEAVRERLRTPPASAPSGPDCPSAEALVEACLGEGTAARRREVIDHLSGCAACSVAWRVARDTRGGDARRAGLRVAPWARVIAGLAAALFVAVVVLPWREWLPGTPSPDRGDPAVGLAVEPVHDAHLGQPPSRLAWPVETGAERYRVQLFDHESTQLWDSGWLVATSIDLPHEVRARIARGRPCYWRVVADVDLVEVHSPLYRFTVEP